jgi:hypothetical protein
MTQLNYKNFDQLFLRVFAVIGLMAVLLGSTTQGGSDDIGKYAVSTRSYGPHGALVTVIDTTTGSTVTYGVRGNKRESREGTTPSFQEGYSVSD